MTKPYPLPLSFNTDAFPEELGQLASPHTAGGAAVLKVLAQVWQDGFDAATDEEAGGGPHPNPFTHRCKAPGGCSNQAVEGTQVCPRHREQYLSLLTRQDQLTDLLKPTQES